DALGFAAYRAFSLQGSQGPDLTYSPGAATFGSTWSRPLPVDQFGQALISYSGGPGAYQLRHEYYSFADLVKGRVPAEALNGKVVLIGSYYLTGVQDEHLTPTSVGSSSAAQVSAGMAGLEIQANVVQMMLAGPKAFLSAEPPLVVLLIIFALGLLMAFVAARLSVLWGLIATAGALAVFTF